MDNNLRSTRKSDAKLEIIMQKFFNLVYRINDISFERCTEKELQLKGQDVVIHKNGKSIIVDEKCATSYWDKPLNTFVMELSSVKCDRNGYSTGERYDGWFVNDKNITDMYSIGYVRANSLEEFKSGKITTFECILLSKEKLKKYIEDTLHIKDIKELEKMFFERVENGKISREERSGKYSWYIADGLKLVLSDNLAECPLNITVNKKILIKVAEIHGLVEYESNRKFTYTA